MADFDDDFDDVTTDTTDTNDGLKQLRQAAKDGKRAKADADAAREEASNARRELAFLRAGIDPDSQTAKRIAKVHEGDITAEALKATAVEYGWAEVEAPQIDPAEVAAHGQFASASSGSVDGITSGDEFMATVDKAKSNWHSMNGEQAVLDALAKAGIEMVYDAWKPATNAQFPVLGVDKLGTRGAFG